MRTCFSFLLAILLSLNAAYAAAAGVCNVLEHTLGHAEHFVHHSHEHGDDHIHDNPPVDPNGSGKMPTLGDHHHDHAHPSFFSILPDIIGVMPLTEGSLMVVIPASIFVSAPQALLDRPPRVTLA